MTSTFLVSVAQYIFSNYFKPRLTFLYNSIIQINNALITYVQIYRFTCILFSHNLWSMLLWPTMLFTTLSELLPLADFRF